MEDKVLEVRVEEIRKLRKTILFLYQAIGKAKDLMDQDTEEAKTVLTDALNDDKHFFY